MKEKVKREATGADFFPTYSFADTSPYGRIPDDIQSPLCKVYQQVGMTAIKIIYSRPSLWERELYGELLIEGKEWRTGANKATTIHFNDPVRINGQELKPGIYALYTIPNRNLWEVIFNADIFRNPCEGRKPKADVLRLEIPVFPLDCPVETFTIFISDICKDNTSASIDLMWETTMIKMFVEVPKKW